MSSSRAAEKLTVPDSDPNWQDRSKIVARPTILSSWGFLIELGKRVDDDGCESTNLQLSFVAH